jgi:hypothetical protein
MLRQNREGPVRLRGPLFYSAYEINREGAPLLNGQPRVLEL